MTLKDSSNKIHPFEDSEEKNETIEPFLTIDFKSKEMNSKLGVED